MSQPATPQPPAPAKVKIRLLRDAKVNGKVARRGSVHEVDDEQAKLLCDKTFPGYLPFYGAQPALLEQLNGGVNPLANKGIRRAERIA